MFGQPNGQPAYSLVSIFRRLIEQNKFGGQYLHEIQRIELANRTWPNSM